MKYLNRMTAPRWVNQVQACWVVVTGLGIGIDVQAAGVVTWPIGYSVTPGSVK